MKDSRDVLHTQVSIRSVAWLVVAGVVAVGLLDAYDKMNPVALVAGGAAIMCALVMGPARRLFADRHDADALPADEIERRLEDLEARVFESTAVEQRVAELENRLDFAERLLAQRADAPPFPLYRTPV